MICKAVRDMTERKVLISGKLITKAVKQIKVIRIFFVLLDMLIYIVKSNI